MPLPQFARKLEQFGIEFSKLTHRMLTEIKPEETTLLQFEILHFLFSEDSVTLGRIGACTGMSLPNTSREVKKLVEKKLVIKKADIKDKRVHYVGLSPQGEKLMADSSAKLEGLITERFAHWSAEETAEVMRAVDLLSEKLLG